MFHHTPLTYIIIVTINLEGFLLDFEDETTVLLIGTFDAHAYLMKFILVFQG